MSEFRTVDYPVIDGIATLPDGTIIHSVAKWVSVPVEAPHQGCGADRRWPQYPAWIARVAPGGFWSAGIRSRGLADFDYTNAEHFWLPNGTTKCRRVYKKRPAEEDWREHSFWSRVIDTEDCCWFCLRAGAPVVAVKVLCLSNGGHELPDKPVE